MIVLPDYLKPLERLTRPFPREAVEAAIARREEATPYLLEALNWAADHPAEVEHDVMIHVFALYLLAQFGETRALEAVVRIARSPDVERLLGDTITEGLGASLATLADRDLRPIQMLIEDEKADAFARGAGIDALGAMVLAGKLTRNELSSYLGTLFKGRLARTYSHVWDALVGLCADLSMVEHLEEIRTCFDEGLPDFGYEDLEGIEQRIQAGRPDDFAQQNYRLIDDTVNEMAWWACFSEKSRWEPTEPDLAKAATLPPRPYESPVPYARPSPKVGRNDPCPCGSKKKFKKCCGA